MIVEMQCHVLGNQMTCQIAAPVMQPAEHLHQHNSPEPPTNVKLHCQGPAHMAQDLLGVQLRATYEALCVFQLCEDTLPAFALPATGGINQ
jgi:hypothetical protein